jgi:hypothetical protein
MPSPTVCEGRATTTCFILQEDQPGTAEIQFTRPGVPGILGSSEVNAGGPLFHRPDGPQANHLRLPPEVGRVFPRQFHHMNIFLFTTDI